MLSFHPDLIKFFSHGEICQNYLSSSLHFTVMHYIVLICPTKHIEMSFENVK